MAKEGLGILVVSLILTVFIFLSFIITQSIVFLSFTLIFLSTVLFLIFFFRDPKRKIAQGANLIISPADGRIVELSSFSRNEFLQSPGTKVSIFLSILNVHINRTPLNGEVRYVKYTPGRFNPAFKDKASSENEQNEICIENDTVRLIIKQISGKLARRIVCYLKEGDKITAGERFGMIKFGSRVELFLPEKVQILVKLNQKIRAGETIIGSYSMS